MARKGQPVSGSSRRATVFGTCLVASGVAALMYQVLWLRELSLVMGHTVYALSAVLAAFLGGLALGAYAGGRLTAARGASLRLYAGVEIGIGVLGASMPWLVEALSPFFGWAYRSLYGQQLSYNLVQFIGCGALLLVPTVLMGATLPIVTALALRDQRDVTRGSAWLYGANSLGGALGAALCGFLVLPALGIVGTGLVAAALNLGVASLAIWLSRVEPAAAAVGPAPPRPATTVAAAARGWPAPSAGAMALIYGLSGFATLTLEVGWSRIVSLSIGSTTYGFTIILFTFIGWLALGSWFVPRMSIVQANPVRAMFAMHAVIALWSLLMLSYLGSLPASIVRLLGGAPGFTDILSTETVLVGATIAVPTLAMGGLFPLVTQVFHAHHGAAGRSIGTAHASNTVGNILGSFVAGFVLIPRLGMRTTIVLAAILAAAAAAAYLLPGLLRLDKPSLLRAGALAAAVAVMALVAPQWDQEVVTSGPYLYGKTIFAEAGSSRSTKAIEDAMRRRFELVEYREGASTVVTVKRVASSGALHLQVGGKSDAYSFASTQNLIAHLPLLLHGNAKDVLVVGLGSGSTLGSVLKHPVERVDDVEISAEVRDMARKYFSEFTDRALDDPRANVIIGDGRNHVRHAGRLYDVIVSQPSNPWISGAAGLFTKDYFEEVRDHLKPGGIACSWFKFTDDDGRGMRSVIRSWHEVFPSSYLFETRVLAENVLVGLRDPGPLRAGAVVGAPISAALQADLARLSIVEPTDVFSYLFLGPKGMARCSEGGVLNTDDRAFLEFMGPRLVQAQRKLWGHADLAQCRSEEDWRFDMEGADPLGDGAVANRLAEIEAAKDLVVQAIAEEAARGRTAEWQRLIQEATALYPREPYASQFAGQRAATADEGG